MKIIQKQRRLDFRLYFSTTAFLKLWNHCKLNGTACLVLLQYLQMYERNFVSSWPSGHVTWSTISLFGIHLLLQFPLLVVLMKCLTICGFETGLNESFRGRKEFREK